MRRSVAGDSHPKNVLVPRGLVHPDRVLFHSVGIKPLFLYLTAVYCTETSIALCTCSKKELRNVELFFLAEQPVFYFANLRTLALHKLLKLINMYSWGV